MGTEELIERLEFHAMSQDANLSFIMGVAAGKLYYQQQRIAELEAALESADMEREDLG